MAAGSMPAAMMPLTAAPASLVEGKAASEIDDTRLDDDARVGNIHFQDAIHPREAEDDPVFNRQRATAQARAGATRDERNFLVMAEANYGLHLLCRSR